MKDERDMISGLRTRGYAMAQLEQALVEAMKQGSEVAVLLTDFDHYHSWNHEYGHALGDVMLQQLSNVAQVVVGENGVIARYSGDEFLIILSVTSSTEALATAEQLREQIGRQQIDVHGQLVPAVTMTIGLALYPEHGADTLALLRSADEAVIQGKQAGRDCVVLARHSATKG